MFETQAPTAAPTATPAATPPPTSSAVTGDHASSNGGLLLAFGAFALGGFMLALRRRSQIQH